MLNPTNYTNKRGARCEVCGQPPTGGDPLFLEKRRVADPLARKGWRTAGESRYGHKGCLESHASSSANENTT